MPITVRAMGIRVFGKAGLWSRPPRGIEVHCGVYREACFIAAADDREVDIPVAVVICAFEGNPLSIRGDLNILDRSWVIGQPCWILGFTVFVTNAHQPRT